MPSDDVLGKTKMPVDVAAVESKAQRVFGPEMLASDRTWDPLECFGLWWYLFLGPLRKPLQQLGRKYLNRPAALPAFRRQAERIANRHLRKLASDPVASQHLARFISLRQRVYDQCAR